MFLDSLEVHNNSQCKNGETGAPIHSYQTIQKSRGLRDMPACRSKTTVAPSQIQISTKWIERFVLRYSHCGQVVFFPYLMRKQLISRYNLVPLVVEFLQYISHIHNATMKEVLLFCQTFMANEQPTRWLISCICCCGGCPKDLYVAQKRIALFTLA